MIVIVEGANATGKTQFCDFLKVVHDFTVIKDNSVHGIEEQDKRAFAEGGIRGYVTMMCHLPPHKNFAFDRFHITEAVYGMRRGYEMLYIDEIDRRLKDLNVKLLLMDDSLDVLSARSTALCRPMAHASSELQNDMRAMFDASMMDKYCYNLSDPVHDVVEWLHS
jgi:thymidylate kinase